MNTIPKPDEPWCRRIDLAVDVDVDLEGWTTPPLCKCDEPARWVVGFGLGHGPPVPRLVCDTHAGKFCRKEQLAYPPESRCLYDNRQCGGPVTEGLCVVHGAREAARRSNKKGRT